jgi:hypothetical protein
MEHRLLPPEIDLNQTIAEADRDVLVEELESTVGGSEKSALTESRTADAVEADQGPAPADASLIKRLPTTR